MFKTLAKIPFIGTFISYVGSNIRLIVEYALIGVLLVVAGVAVSLWFRADHLEGENLKLTGEVGIISEANKSQDATIETLKSVREKDSEVLSGLAADFRRLSVSDVAARRKLAELEKQNADVRAYLDKPIPPDLGRLLNAPDGDQLESGGGKAASDAARSMRPPARPSVPDNPRPAGR